MHLSVHQSKAKSGSEKGRDESQAPQANRWFATQLDLAHLEGICEQQLDIRLLIQQHLRAEVTHALVAELWGRDKLECLQLRKVCGVPEHVDVQHLRKQNRERLRSVARMIA